MTSAPAIDVHGLTKRYGERTVVDGLTMQVARGEIFGFLGPNGSGKTTSIRMMCGLLTPDGGEGHTLGLDVVRQSGEIKKRVGYMTQRFGLYEDLSIQENLDFVARDLHGEAVDHGALAVALGEAMDVDGGRRCHGAAASVTSTGRPGRSRAASAVEGQASARNTSFSRLPRL